ncbi:FAD-binding and (Fe-S)-binding domain-containing protein [Herbiconiux ginsengi]|uniref:FAD/FMN-containing dehydrogenase n=1 Tax=Herbiconiux ginsengi TaxID=381665 RepID=A0A1H3MWQ9_9MICO|nr:FAD-binding and (Fe-S)-binding domain-containing protein [Herbiconiux ginsengi]SDY80928.1 FAD/FMN-containing dehydrogenase [Herbiconiux ginsengi]
MTTAIARDLAARLRESGFTEVDDSRRRRAEYSSDASNYRVVPEVVVFPRAVDEVAGLVEFARTNRVPLTARGGGTSVAGNAIGPGIVMDLSRHLDRVTGIDPDARTAVVEPGATLGSLQRAAAPFGLRFGPDPSTWARATLGGMIGNNACGPRALAFGRTADNVVALDVADGRGRRFTAGRGGAGGGSGTGTGTSGIDRIDGLDALVSANLDVIRTELGSFGRQISGYSLEHLLPENGRDLAKALVGTEGTLVAVLGATVRLVDLPRDPVLVVLGYPDMPSAADAVPALLAHHPMAIEGMDSRLIDAVVRHSGPAAAPDLPAGRGWLLVEVADREPGDAWSRAERLARDAGTSAVRILPAGPEARALWRIREDGAGLAGRTAANRQAWPGVEDAAVPPEHLGAYLRDFDDLLRRYELHGMPYGHFGDGCVHVRLDIPLDTDGDVLRSFLEDAAILIASHGGSLSGEHGDGRARSDLLRHMYSPRMLDLFAGFKNLFDPEDVLNPGVIVRPASVNTDLRRPHALPIAASNGLAFVHDDGDVTKAVHRCVGVGKCRADNSASGGFMCPSYLATKDEKDSTRGRARVLQEMINGSLVEGGWAAPEVHESLDLCLSCKACSSDCPAGVDMAAYKSEVLHRTYRGRLRPVTHYTLGWLPRWARLATRVSGLANAVLSVRALEKLVLRAGGMDARRSIPRFARRSFRAWWRRRGGAAPGRAPVQATTRKRVLLWVDTFSDTFSPTVGRAAVAVLESAGYEVVVPNQAVCCGLTWITTGQLTAARAKLAQLVEVFHPYVAAGIPILGLEPSCTAVLRSDLLELLPGDARAQDVAAAAYTLAELLAAPEPVGPGPDWVAPDLSGRTVVVQPHCHHHSVMGFGPDEKLLTTLGAETTVLSGCCGLAGNFGMERGHYDVSVAVAENSLLPGLRAAPEGSILLADGLSCRTQADQLAGAKGIHLAELLAGARRD